MHDQDHRHSKSRLVDLQPHVSRCLLHLPVRASHPHTPIVVQSGVLHALLSPLNSACAGNPTRIALMGLFAQSRCLALPLCVCVCVCMCVCSPWKEKLQKKKGDGDGDSVVVELHLAWSLGSRLCWLSDFSCVFRRLTNITSDLNPPNIAGERAWGLLGCHNILGILLTPRTRR